MYIKSMVLDGFKSFGHRVEINGFDREFNAITGLNGAGKSNILDGICFVLGISNLSHVRATNLQDLVFKSGQAGITKASVSITFDNTDRNQCPMGYENHKEITVTRQVILGGKSKYKINGVNCPNNRVTDLFCSVQLNVNNPTFLIMQGRILKILNMNSVDILGMVEEAVGTKMYENKKLIAQNTIAKKDAKLKELNEIIAESIAPRLQKLQDERSQYQEFQNVVRELENLQRLHHAWMYTKLEESAENITNQIEQVKDEIKGKEEKITDNEKEANNIAKFVADMSKRLDAESGGELQKHEEQFQDVEKRVTELSRVANASHQTLMEYKKGQTLLCKELKDDENTLTQKLKQLNEAEATWGSIRTACEEDAAALQAAQAKLVAAKTMAAKDNGAGATSLVDQLADAQNAAFEASVETSRCLTEKKSLEETINAKQKEFNSNSEQYNKDTAKIVSIEKEVREIESEMERLNCNENLVSDLKATSRQLNSALLGLRDRIGHMSSRLQQCNLNYVDPEPNFNRSSVHGVVCRLISVNDPIYCTALEQAAGSKLYNVIVDTDITGKLLLQKGQLQKRITIIPLNKIHGNSINRQTVDFAKQLVGADNVHLALSLIRYDQKVKSAIEWVFGQTLICKDLNVARTVTYHPRIMKRCVTLNGEVVDPQGTLYGGARSNEPSTLAGINQLKESEAELSTKESELEKIQMELRSTQQAFEKYSTLKGKHNFLLVELKGVKESMQKNKNYNLHEELKQLKATLKEKIQTIEQSKKIYEEQMRLQKDMEVKMKDIKGYRERELNKVEADIQKMMKQAEMSRNKWKNMEEDFDNLKGEVRDLKSNIETVKKQVAVGEANLLTMEQHFEKDDTDLNEAKEEMKAIQGRVKLKKNEIANRNKEISKTLQKKDQVLSSNTDLGLQIKELQHKITRMQTESAEYGQRLKNLCKANSWITSERKLFGVAGSLYDFNSRDPTIAGQRIAQLTERKEKLARGGVNSRAHTLLGKEEEQFNDIMRKKQIVEQDRAKLLRVIQNLDEKKMKALILACDRVNKDFGSIFSALLPNAQTKLVPPAGQTVLEGLEIKVGFSKVWKDSISELSGGQRSLVALSLVLAMLNFKPAPIYILDEVDAALDLSHTQNIGGMLKDHFNNSQFIIVSLKDGMFTNANVLFRTKYQDGMSTVQRTARESSH